MADLVITAANITTTETPVQGRAGEALATGDAVFLDTADTRWKKAPNSVAETVQTGVVVSGAVAAEQPVLVLTKKNVTLNFGAILTLKEIYVISATSGAIAPIGDLTADINEVQSVEIASATGGTFTLTFSGQTTAPIAFDATAAAVKAALEALSNIDLVAATGGPMNTAPVSIEFQGDNAATNVAEMTIDTSLLTGTPTSAILTTTAGKAADTLYILGVATSTSALRTLFQYTGA